MNVSIAKIHLLHSCLGILRCSRLLGPNTPPSTLPFHLKFSKPKPSFSPTPAPTPTSPSTQPKPTTISTRRCRPGAAISSSTHQSRPISSSSFEGIAPITDVSGNRGGVYSVTSPAFQLTILDPKSNIALWTITSPVNVTGKNQVLARWVSISETNLVSRVKVVADQSLSPDETADLTTVPKYHNARSDADRRRRLRRRSRRRRPHHVPLARKRIGKYESLAGCLLHGKQHSSLPVRRRLIAAQSRTRHPRDAIIVGQGGAAGGSAADLCFKPRTNSLNAG